MKKIYLLTALLSTIISYAQSVSFENISIVGTENYWNGSDLSGVEATPGIFTKIFDENDFELSSVYDTSWGMAYGYWSTGWAFSNQTSDTLTNLNGQHSSFAGGTQNGQVYAVGQQNSRITRNNSNYLFESIEVSNSNYAAHSMLNGDDFAKQFGGSSGDDPDWFLLTIVGFDELDTRMDSVEFYLADYRFTNNTQDYIIKAWETIDLSPIENASYIEFSMTSSDEGSWGMNTPSFFTIDNLNYSSPAQIDDLVSNTNLIYPNPTSEVLSINRSFSFTEYEIISLTGEIVQHEKTNQSVIQVNNLPSGSYYIRVIGDKEISTQPFIKL